MSRSLFAVTFKKSGWDCMRHLEIMAAGALPVFTDIADLPAGTMAAYPREVCGCPANCTKVAPGCKKCLCCCAGAEATHQMAWVDRTGLAGHLARTRCVLLF
jgi:hypothetical protein